MKNLKICILILFLSDLISCQEKEADNYYKSSYTASDKESSEYTETRYSEGESRNFSEEEILELIRKIEIGDKPRDMPEDYLEECKRTVAPLRDVDGNVIEGHYLCYFADIERDYYYSFSFCTEKYLIYAVYDGNEEKFIDFDIDICGEDHVYSEGTFESIVSQTQTTESNGQVQEEPEDISSVEYTYDDSVYYNDDGFYVIGYDSWEQGWTKYLGCWSCDEYDSESIHNDYSDYGSAYSSKSIRNEYSDYGGRYGYMSACNEYATKPPIVVDGEGNAIAYLSVNEYDSGSICYNENDVCTLLKSYCF